MTEEIEEDIMLKLYIENQEEEYYYSLSN